MRRIIAGIICLLFNTVSFADTVKLTNGGTLECTVVQEQKDKLVLQYGKGLVTIPRSMVESMVRAPTTPESKTTPKSTALSAGPRLPTWKTVISKIAQQKWAESLQQIPATVIDAGVLKHIPYKSHRCGIDYEFNVYGDPDSPAGFEIGIYRTLLADHDAKKNCIEIVCSVLSDPKDVAIVRLLDLQEDKITRGDVTFEITPSTAEDAYGGWWISVYNETALDTARASEPELEVITQKIGEVKSEAPPAKPPAPAPSVASATPDEDANWQPSELRYARPSRSASTAASSSGGRVFVRGYFRKDGTYVRPHSRRR